MYDRTCGEISVNAARKELFTKKKRPMDRIPPTADALLLHTKRAVLIAGHVWGNCLNPNSNVPDPSEWGWEMRENNIWKPKWMSLPPASKGV